jgi:hypothetical protein
MNRRRTVSAEAQLVDGLGRKARAPPSVQELRQKVQVRFLSPACAKAVGRPSHHDATAKDTAAHVSG